MKIISKRKINKYKNTHRAYKKYLCYNCYYNLCGCFSSIKTQCKDYEDDKVTPAKYKKGISK